MTKPRRPHGRFETSLRGVANDARRSVAMTVILLPALSANVFALCKGVTPLQWIVVISLSMATVFLLSLCLKWRTIPIQASGFIPDTLTQDQLSRIRGLVTVVSSMDEAGSRPVQGLIRGIPTLEVVYCVTCEGDASDKQIQLLRTWAAEQGWPNLDIRPLSTTPNRYKFDEAVADRLSEELGLLEDRTRIIVDVTADTKLMTLALHLAATLQAMPVTYVRPADRQNPEKTFALSVIRDPNGFFATDPPTLPERGENIDA